MYLTHGDVGEKVRSNFFSPFFTRALLFYFRDKIYNSLYENLTFLKIKEEYSVVFAKIAY